MMRLFSNGCSFLVPRPKDGVHTFTTKILSEQYDMELYNLAMGGRGNDRISFTTKLWFEKNNFTDVFAVIGWSSALRNDYISSDMWKVDKISGQNISWRSYNFCNLPEKFIRKIKNLDVEKTSSMKWIDNIIDLQNFFQLKKIPYVMYNSLPPFLNEADENFSVLYKNIDQARFFKTRSSHYDFIMENKHIVSPNDPHPSTEGHKLWTKQLKEFIDADNLRTI